MLSGVEASLHDSFRMAICGGIYAIYVETKKIYGDFDVCRFITTYDLEDDVLKVVNVG